MQISWDLSQGRCVQRNTSLNAQTLDFSKIFLGTIREILVAIKFIEQQYQQSVRVYI